MLRKQSISRLILFLTLLLLLNTFPAGTWERDVHSSVEHDILRGFQPAMNISTPSHSNGRLGRVLHAKFTGESAGSRTIPLTCTGIDPTHISPFPSSFPTFSPATQEMGDKEVNALETGRSRNPSRELARMILACRKHDSASKKSSRFRQVRKQIQILLAAVFKYLNRLHHIVWDYVRRHGYKWASADSHAWLHVVPFACDDMSSYSVRRSCQTMKLKLLQGFILKHNFFVLFLRHVDTSVQSPWWLLCSRLPHVSEPQFDYPIHPFDHASTLHVGGGRIPTFTLKELKPFLPEDMTTSYAVDSTFRFIGHYHLKLAEANHEGDDDHIYGAVPLQILLPRLTVKDMTAVAKTHRVALPYRCQAARVAELSDGHYCSVCTSHVSVFSLHVVQTTTQRTRKHYKTKEVRAARVQQDKERRQQSVTKEAHANSERQRRERLNEFPPTPTFSKASIQNHNRLV